MSLSKSNRTSRFVLAPLVALLSSSLFIGCGYYHQDKESAQDSNFNFNGKASESGFSEIKAQILDRFCTQCHTSGTAKKPRLVEHSEVFAQIVAVRADVVSGKMPKHAAMASGAIRALVEWIDAGAQELAPNKRPDGPKEPEPKPEELDPTLNYNTVKAIVLKDHCMECHSEKNAKPPKKPLLTNYKQFFDLRDKIHTKVSDGTMPPIDDDILGDWEASVLLAWVTAGAPEKSDLLLPEKPKESTETQAKASAPSSSVRGL